MSITDEIKRLHELHLAGALTEQEFAQAKEKLLAEIGNGVPASDSSSKLVNQLNSLRRSNTDRWLGGVCGGLAKLTGMESWLWRLIFILFTLYFGFGVIVYILAWILIPDEA